MKLQNRYVFAAVYIATSILLQSARAATIWNGPTTTFTKADGADATQAANQDRMTANVWITRADSYGIYNAKTEGGFTHFSSPADTEWANGTTANYNSLSYTDWNTWAKGVNANPPSTVGVDAVLHLISEDIYLDIRFTAWTGAAGGGGFAYQRSTPTPPNTPPSVSITNPANGATFSAPANVTIMAQASDNGSVTNVEFFDNGVSLGSDTTNPYSVNAGLAIGSHALTAVATDNLGLSTTSSPPVNVTVNVPNNPPSVTITNPASNTPFANTASVAVNISATDSDGSVTNVQLFNGAVLLRNFTAGPYTFSGTALAGSFTLGTNVLTAVARDNLGTAVTSAPVNVIIARYLPPLTNGNIALFLIPVATGMSAPLYGISPPGDKHRLFVVEQNGLLRIIKDGVLQPGAALDIQNRVQPPLNPGNPNDERGFLGLAFHPGFNNPASPGYRTLYTYNSETNPPATSPTYPVPTNVVLQAYKNVINEWKISNADTNVVDPASRREVISFGKIAGNHNGGTCTFGPDGYMYLALGDGGDANDVGSSHLPGGNAQNLITPLGKFLRFDPLNPTLNPTSPNPISTNGQYRIPTDNPFHGDNELREIYALGVRNPYRFCFDTLTGDLIHADVGQNNIEEIDKITIGGNYGWPIKEGDFYFNQVSNSPTQLAGTVGRPGDTNRNSASPPGMTLIDPYHGLEYDHNEGISITGGFVYRGTAIPELYGKYIFGDLALKTQPVRADGRIFFADLQAGTINSIPLPQFGGSAVLPNGLTVHGFAEDADGEVYALVTNTPANGSGGIVYKLASIRLTAKPAGNTIDISWPVAGARLQAQTNGLSSTWSDVPNSTTTNRMLLPVGPANNSVFYRLAVP